MSRQPFIYPKTCQACGKSFLANKKSRMFCSYACSGISKRKPLPTYTCKGCGQTFTPSGHRENTYKYCSHTCYLQHHPRRIDRPEKICTQCGKAFHSKNQVCCSKACVTASQTTRQRQTCPICEKTFEAVPAELRKGKGRFCSPRCAREHQKRQRIQCTCEQCGNAFEVIPSQRQFRNPRFCSPECWRKFSGETTPERIVREILESLGIEFVQEHPFLTYYLDFFLPTANIALEVDGDYWHKGKLAHDTHRDQQLADCGVRTIRIKESELVNSSDAVQLVAAKLS